MNIIQQPLYKMLAADEEIIFVVKDAVTVATTFKVKFTAELFVTSQGNAAMALPADKVATLKVIPNNAGVGIFDFSRILESYVSPEYLGGETVTTNGTTYYTKANQINYDDKQPHAIHQIDEFSNSRHCVKNFAVRFDIEFALTPTGPIERLENARMSFSYYVHNAVRQEDEHLAIDTTSGNFGYDYNLNNFALNDTSSKFLTRCPTVQYIGSADYHTLAFFQESGIYEGGGSLYGAPVAMSSTINSPEFVKMQFYYNGFAAGNHQLTNGLTTGGNYWNGANASEKILFVGVGTANITGAGGSVPANWDYYTVKAYEHGSLLISDTYYFYNQCIGRGFEKIRLTWLNRLGTWDYFNFTRRNVRKVNSKRETYQQLKGSWNEKTYKKHGHQGGRKTFSTNSKEVVTLQSEFVTEEAAAWLEELFTSPDVFVLQERTSDLGLSPYKNIINKYVQPCVVTSSSYTKKTTANDKLKQYTLEIEMSHNKRIQKA